MIAVAVASVSQCFYCIKGHTEVSLKKGEELMEAIWVASKMHAGAAYAYSAIAKQKMEITE